MTTPNNPGQLYTLDWESSNCGDMQPPLDWSRDWDEKAKAPYRVACPPHDPVRSGSRSARFELNHDDPMASDSIRTELATASDPDNAERWYGFSIFLAGDQAQGWVVDTEPEALTQWHQSYPLSNPLFDGSPPLSLGTRGQQWEIRLRDWDDLAANRTVAIYTTPWEANRWTDWVFHVKWRSTAEGLVQVWKDGGTEPVVNKTDMQTKFPDGQGNYMKFGIYKWKWVDGPTATSRRIIFYDELRIADETGSREVVSPPAQTRPHMGCLGALIKPFRRL